MMKNPISKRNAKKKDSKGAKKEGEEGKEIGSDGQHFLLPSSSSLFLSSPPFLSSTGH